MKKNLLFSLLLTVFSLSLTNAQVDIVEVKGVSYLKNTVVAKLKVGKSLNFISSTSSFQFVSEKLGDLESSIMFPNAFMPRERVDKTGRAYADLTRIVVFTYGADVQLEQAIRMINSLGCFEYVEGKVIPQLSYIPSDPKAGDQYHLEKIKAYEAWDVEQGDTNVIIGITDTGIKFGHGEFDNDIAYNPYDPENGIDDDFDGYIDNYRGYDLAEDDNNPTWQSSQHGVWVAGMANAGTDNDNEGAAIGFKTKILPVKISTSQGYLTHAYEGIVYAADHGAHVINCSWGSEGGYSALGQDVIDYATINKRALVVAAAGNNNNGNYFYPASYKGVLSVGGTNPDDGKWINNSTFGSNYNDLVDVSAPSDNVVTTTTNGTTRMIGDGTSFASPIVAGVAALIKSKYPASSPEQITGRITMTADDIYSLPANASYIGLLGEGRVNAYNALTQNNIAYLTVHDFSMNDGSGNDLAIGDTVDLEMLIMNHLMDADNVVVSISSTSSSISFISDTDNIGTVLGEATKESNFRFVVQPSAGMNERISIDVVMTDGNKTWKDKITFTVNRDYVNVTLNNVDFSFNNYGRVGYTFSNDGLGVQYQEQGSLIKEMGVMLSAENGDAKFYRDYELLGFDPVEIKDSEEADFVVEGTFNDMWAPSPTGLEIHQQAMVWEDVEDLNYAIYEYTIRNNTGADFDSVYLGLFGDWAMGSEGSELVSYNSRNKLAVVTGSNGFYGGIATLRSVKSHFYAFNSTPTDGSINALQGYTDANQYASLTGGIQRSTASGEVQSLNGQGPFNVQRGDSVVVAFAIVVGGNEEELIASAKRAQKKYDDLRGIEFDIQNLRGVSCFGDEDGSISLDIEAGLGLTSYEWFHDPADTNLTLENLSKGTYNIKAVDKNGVEKSLNLTVTEPEPLSLTVSDNIEASCNQRALVESMYSITGGTPNYTYDWGSSVIPAISNPDLENGSYILTIGDANDCEVSDTVVVDNPEPIIIHVLEVKDDTINGCVGSVRVAVDGGEGELDIVWDHTAELGQTRLFDLCEDEYFITVTDEMGCEQTKSIEVGGEPAPLSAIEEKVADARLYPNPSINSSVLEFDLISSEMVHISIFNAMGQEVEVLSDSPLTQGHVKVIVPTAQLNAGQYYIHVSAGGNRSVIPLSVIK